MGIRRVGVAVLLLLSPVAAPAQEKKPLEIKDLIQTLKADPRGPFEAIRWFCTDGSVLSPQERCAQPGGVQHGLHKTVVRDLARERGLYLGQVLAGTPHEEFLDASNGFSRLVQYQIEQYLQTIDDGWIFRRARYYRGAFQAEDEEAWGRDFLIWMAGRDDLAEKHFFLLREAARHIPHNAKDDRLSRIRMLAKSISDQLPDFLAIRIKIHGQPDAKDLDAVRSYYRRNGSKLAEELDGEFQKLISELELAYRPFDFQSLGSYRDGLPAGSEARRSIQRLMDSYAGAADASPGRIEDLAETLLILRKNLPELPPGSRLTALDASIEIERLLYKNATGWKPESVGMLFQKTRALATGAAGAGYLELWEWDRIRNRIDPPETDGSISLEQLVNLADTARRIVEWGSGMVQAVYEPGLEIFSGFEPLSIGFIDEQVRGSVLLPLGDAAGALREYKVRKSGMRNRVVGSRNPTDFYGLNPGYALGELVVVDTDRIPTEIAFKSDKIYVLPVAPPDLKPVAGILTTSEGNLVSHVQLLARNLGVPNAVLSRQNIKELAAFNGRTVFFAVSPGGVVVIKPDDEMTPSERELFAASSGPDEKIRFPVERLDLENTRLRRLSELRAIDSGRIVGPKAANLGQLKSMFPESIGEGLVIPFSVFRQHFNQTMPGQGITYWQFLQETFTTADPVPASQDASEERILSRLKTLREALKTIALLPEFERGLELQFASSLGSPMGHLPVFIRSDTNMEDLKDFTGAGLNLTVFNVVEKEKILQAIRDVWASPFTERSYRWRQKFLLNPENVYPSILILPTVDVAKSGVMITTGIVSQRPEDTTVAFNQGAGGAVEGQRAETYLMRPDGSRQLLSPVREARYTTLPGTGGSSKAWGSFASPLLSDRDLDLLESFSKEIRRRLPGMSGMESDGPYDVEIGFLDGRVVLFQVRPFVESKRAKSSMYLRQLDSGYAGSGRISLQEDLDQENAQ